MKSWSEKLRFTALLPFLLLSPALAGEYRTFTSNSGQELVAKVITVDSRSAVLERESDGKRFTLLFANLIEEDQEWLENWEPGMADEADDHKTQTADEAASDADLNRQLYPRTREEIRTRIAAILKRPAVDGFPQEHTDALNLLNVHRYLAGVSDNVVLDKVKNDQAQQAAEICREKGSLSHDFGHFTDKCNLGAGRNLISQHISGYINDSGDNNREARGHRRWCLNPPMGKVGFGRADGFSAMDCMDSSGKTSRIRGVHGYPANGFFPLEYMLGTGWCIYLDEPAPEAKTITVEVWRLETRPLKPLSATAEPIGEKLEVAWISTALNCINFEPAYKNEPGIYWVRIGGRARAHYLVEFF